MLKFVYPKINIGLNITGCRPDGYHTLQTIFHTLESPVLNDILEIVPTLGKDSLQVIGTSVGCPPEKNLVWKALQLFRQETEIRECFKIILLKKLPCQAGMGGGSADATATLQLLNEMCETGLSTKKLHRIALKLGADCPYFLHNKACYATGIGDELTEIDLDLSKFGIMVVKPTEAISTSEAFRYVKQASPLPDLQAAVRLNPSEWVDIVSNDFEMSVFKLYPHLQKLKKSLYLHGALFASMTGSGSAFYGIYSTLQEADSAAAAINEAYGYSTWVV